MRLLGYAEPRLPEEDFVGIVTVMAVLLEFCIAVYVLSYHKLEMVQYKLGRYSRMEPICVDEGIFEFGFCLSILQALFRRSKFPAIPVVHVDPIDGA